MKMILKKIITLCTSATLISTVFIGTDCNKSYAEDLYVDLKPWTFTQAGIYANKEDSATGNVGYINSVSINNSNEVLSNWPREIQTNEPANTMTATTISNGFTIDIANNGWDYYPKDYFGSEYDLVKPWAIEARMKDVEIKQGYQYKVKFKAKASSRKYAYISFLSRFNNGTEFYPPYGEDVPFEAASQYICLDTTEKEYSYSFTCWETTHKYDITISLGAFNAEYSIDGYIANILPEREIMWNGTVSISDFSIQDNGRNSDHTMCLPEYIPNNNPVAQTPITETTVETPAKNKKPKLNKTSLKLKVGKKAKLSVKNAKGKIKWLSSKKKIAIVSSKGKVTAVKKGKCNIIAIVNGKKLKCTIKVIK